MHSFSVESPRVRLASRLSPSAAVSAMSPYVAVSPRLRMSVKSIADPHGQAIMTSTGAETPAMRAAREDDVATAGTSGFLATVFNATNLLIGIGLLAYPFALRRAGWSGMLILAILAGITRYTAGLLGECIEKNPGVTTYADMGFKSMGKAAALGITFVFFFELLVGACSAFLVVQGDSLNKLFPQISVSLFMCAGAILVLPTTWLKDLSWLSYVSLLGFVSSLVLVGAVLYTGATQTCSEHPCYGSLSHPAPTVFFVPETAAFSLGILMIGFAGHAVFPSIYLSMKNKQQYAPMLNITYVIVYIVYGGMAAVGYLMYGDQTQGEITLNLPSGWLEKATIWLIVVNTLSKYALTLDPLAAVADGILDSFWPATPDSKEEGYKALLDSFESPAVVRSSVNSSSDGCLTKERLRSIFIRTFLTGVTLLIAVYLPYFDRLMSFCGSFLSFTVSIVFPPAAHMGFFWQTTPMWQKVTNVFLVGFGVVLALVGTAAAVLGHF